ncbi:MAG: MATE family efflux transporter [Myxococcales bacterium]
MSSSTTDRRPPPADRAQRMGTEPVPRLLLEFSLPVMTGMVVQALYAVVNRAFIGNAPEAARTGMAAITVGMPIVLISMAFGGLVAFGGAAALSIDLGEQDQGRAERAVSTSLVLSALIGVVLTVAGLAALDPLLVLLGAAHDVLPAARDYNRLLLLSTIPGNVGFAMSSLIRAEGNPAKSMRIMIVSALCNAALDYLFIMVLHWGVRGAATATLLAQTLSATLALAYYMNGRSHVRLRFRPREPGPALDPAIARRILALGSSAFFMQLANSFVQFVLNRRLSQYGGDLALAS